MKTNLSTRFVLLVALTTAALVFAGCAMRAVIGGGAPSPDGRSYLAVTVRTPPGIGYDERSEKSVTIGISTRGTEPSENLLLTQYSLTAGQLDWDVKWESNDRVTVELFEHPPGVSMSSTAAIERKTPRISIRTVTFARASGLRRFEPVI